MGQTLSTSPLLSIQRKQIAACFGLPTLGKNIGRMPEKLQGLVKDGNIPTAGPSSSRSSRLLHGSRWLLDSYLIERRTVAYERR